MLVHKNVLRQEGEMLLHFCWSGFHFMGQRLKVISAFGHIYRRNLVFRLYFNKKGM